MKFLKEKIHKYKVYWFIFIVLILTVMSTALSNDKILPSSVRVFHPGERLIYKVKYFFLRVGTLKLHNEGLVDIDGKKYFKLKIFVDSSPGVPFVNIHDVYESYVDSNSVPVAFYAWEKKGDYTLYTAYEFNYNDNNIRVLIQKEFPDKVEVLEDNMVKINRVYRDVLSLLYFARKKSSENYKNIIIPTFALGGRDSCYFNEAGKLREIKVNGVKQKAYYLQGRVKFIGIAGIKDDFEGWFSTDKQRVPLKAKMKAFFGSINIELEDYENWVSLY